MLHSGDSLANLNALTGFGLCLLFTIMAAIAHRWKRLWISRTAMFLAVASVATALALARFHHSASSSQPSPAAQVGQLPAHLQQVNQATGSSSPAKPEPPFPEPVTPGAASQLPPRLWVVSNRGEAVEYDLSTVAAKQSVTIPADALPSDPRSFPYLVETNRKGQILVGPVSHGDSVDNATCTLWLWNGQSGGFLNCGNKHRQETTPDGSHLLVDVLSRASLAADGEHLFWFVNEQKQTPGNFQENIMPSVATTFHVWETDLSGGQRQEIASLEFPECACDTGACEETCPTASAWTPKSGVDSFFGVYGSYTGQVSPTTYVGESLYRGLPDGRWSSAPLPSSFETEIVDAAEDASAFVVVLPDSACCGWNNESDDQTLLLRKGQTIVLFDEFSRYHNERYDVSYSASEAQLSPDNQFVAMTISSSARPGEEFRASDVSGDDEGPSDAKLSAEDVARINQSLADLPAVEVVTATDPPKRAAYLPNATLVGWLNQREIVIVKDSFLGVYSVPAGTLRKLSIAVGDQSHAFLR